MTDTELEAWLAERRSIHATATEGPWESRIHPLGSDVFSRKVSGEESMVAEIENIADTVSIVDSHNHLPMFFAMVESVLNRHRPVTARYYKTDLNPDREFDCEGCGEGTAYPCPTVRGIEKVIKNA